MLLKGETTWRLRHKQWLYQSQDDPSQGESFTELEGFAAQVCRVLIKLWIIVCMKLVLPSKQKCLAKCFEYIWVRVLCAAHSLP